MTKIIAWGQYVFPSNQFQPPGNSLRAIDVAFGYGYDGIELDVQLSKDDHLVLMHDNTLDRTTLSQGVVNQFTADELSRVVLKDPWNGVECRVERLSRALARVGDRGLVMVDMHHTVPKTVNAVVRAVQESGFDASRLVLLTYTHSGGLLYKSAFPEAVVLLKSPHNLQPPQLGVDFVEQAMGLDGVLVPVAEHPESLAQFRRATAERGLRLAVYMHKTHAADLQALVQSGADFVTSYIPAALGPVSRAVQVVPA